MKSDKCENEHQILSKKTDDLSNWVSIKDQMPKPGQEVLCYRADNRSMFVDALIDKEKINYFHAMDGIMRGSALKAVTHWRVLPSPPCVILS